VIGTDVQVGAGAVVDGSIVWDGARIGADARLTDAIVGFRTEIESGRVLNGDVVADESAVALP
jgi:mannose-1-phosphate guanylyltransferase